MSPFTAITANGIKQSQTYVNFVQSISSQLSPCGRMFKCSSFSSSFRSRYVSRLPVSLKTFHVNSYITIPPFQSFGILACDLFHFHYALRRYSFILTIFFKVILYKICKMLKLVLVIIFGKTKIT